MMFIVTVDVVIKLYAYFVTGKYVTSKYLKRNTEVENW